MKNILIISSILFASCTKQPVIEVAAPSTCQTTYIGRVMVCDGQYAANVAMSGMASVFSTGLGSEAIEKTKTVYIKCTTNAFRLKQECESNNQK